MSKIDTYVKIKLNYMFHCTHELLKLPEREIVSNTIYLPMTYTTNKSIFKGSLKNTPVTHSMIRVLALILQHGKINATDQLTVLSA